MVSFWMFPDVRSHTATHLAFRNGPCQGQSAHDLHLIKTTHRTKPVRHATRRLRFLRSSPPAQRPHNGLPESLTRKRSMVPPLYPSADGVQFPRNRTNCLTSAEIMQAIIFRCRVDFKSGIFVESKSGKNSSLSAPDFTHYEPWDCC